MAESGKKNKKPLMSDIGLEMQETIERVKKMKGHAAAKEKIKEMEQAVSLIKLSYYKGIKTAEDLASGNEDYEATDEEKGKADQVINKLRVGWNSETTMSNARKDRTVDKIHQSAEDAEKLTQINSNSPDIQDFDTASTADAAEYL